MPEFLRYYLPSQGLVSVPLHAESAILYRHLSETREIDRLQRLDHLGTIRLAWEGAHHPRWEYVVAIANLIERCNRDVPDVHLARSVHVPPSGVVISSGAELLKVWALLLNIGHLLGTFTTERALLLALRDELRAEFLARFTGDNELFPWAERIVDEARVYSFYQALAFYRLDELAMNPRAGEGAAGPWSDALRAYVITAATEQLVQLKAVFRNLRRLAYLALDSHYTPSLTKLDLSHILADPEALGHLALRDPDTESDELTGLDLHLTRDIYLGKDALETVAEHDERIGNLIRRRRERLGIRGVLGELTRRPTLLQSGRRPRTILRLPAWVGPPFDDLLLEPMNIRTQQQRVTEFSAHRRSGMYGLWWVAAYGNEWVLQTMARPRAPRSAADAYIYGFGEVSEIHSRLTTGLTRWGFSDEMGRDLLHDAMFKRFGNELLEGAFRLAFGDDFRWEWSRRRGQPLAIFGSRAKLRAQISGLLGTAPERSRQTELWAVSRRLRYRPSAYALAAVSNVHAYRSGQAARAAELDGLIVEIDPSRVRVTVVEAKRRNSGSQAEREARAALDNKLALLPLRASAIVGGVESERNGKDAAAWVTLVLRGNPVPAIRSPSRTT